LIRPPAVLAFLALALLPASALTQADARRDPMQHFFTPSLGDLKAEAADARAAGKQAVFVMYVRDDCPYCERMKANILSLPDVQAYYRAMFIPLAIDLRGSIPITDFAGKATTEKDFARAQNVSFTPVLVFYGFDGQPLARVNGEISDADEFMLLGRFVASGSYRTQSFAQYRELMRTKRPG
jgi:thioredoxin-related protein